MTLVLRRIDDRLIHGQVVVGWGQPMGVSFIALVDDTVATSEWEQELYRMGVPPEMQVYFLTGAQAVAAIPAYDADPRRGILVTGDIATMRALVAAHVVRAVNVGGIHHRAGRVQKLRYVFLSPDEERALQELEQLGARVTAQDVPSASEVPLSVLLAGGPRMTVADVIPVALLGAVLGLDVVSFPQAMISRPLVAATLAGALVGHPENGLLIGAALELIALETLPFGASRYPEWGSAAVVGGALFANHPGHPAGSMSVSMLGALATAWIGGWSMVKLRELNAWWAGRRRLAIDSGSRDAVVSLHLTGMSADLVRGGALTAIAYLALRPITNATVATWGVSGQVSSAVVVGVAASVAAGAAWKLFHGVARARWYFLGGLLIGLLSLASQ